MNSLFKLTCVFLFTGIGLYAQSTYTQISKLKGITETVVTPEMFELIAAIDLDADNPEVQSYKEIINNLKELR
ncbi:MAG: hypothetical protein RQ756_08745, partial [Flavobacteriaceae bacterium]|nr:hypothetical protein [Flavobacteriaceae bacterium]